MASKHCPAMTRPSGAEKRPRGRRSGALSIARWARKEQAAPKASVTTAGDRVGARAPETVA